MVREYRTETRKPKRYQRLYIALFCLFMLIFVGILSHNLAILTRQPIWTDEYVFLKITSNLPDYSSTSNWLSGYSEFNTDLDSKFYDAAYTTEVWGHPPMANIIMYPMTQIADDFINQIQTYRLVYGIFMLITVGLLADVIRRRFGYLIASIALVPMLLSQYLVMAGIYVYHDAAMCMFLALTIWIIEVKPKSRWKFVTAMAMVLTKIYAVAFIIPLALLYYGVNKNKMDMGRILACSLALIPFLIYQWALTGELLYIFTKQWSAANQWNWETFRVIVLPNTWAYILDWGLYIHVPLVIGGMIAYFKEKTHRLHYSYIVLYVLILALAVNGGFMGNKTYPIMYGAMFMVIPLAQKIQAKIEREELELVHG